MAKVGKKAAQSEAGRSATRAAVKGATDAAVSDLSNRYLGPKPGEPVPSPSVKQTHSKQKPTQKQAPPKPSAPTPRATYHQQDSDDEFEEHMRKMNHHEAPPKPSVFKRFKPSINLSKSSEDHRQRSPRSVPKPRNKVYKYVLSKEPDWEQSVRAVALHNFKSDLKCDLEFRKGQWIDVITRTGSDFDWWEGRIGDRVGIFPANYVRVS